MSERGKARKGIDGLELMKPAVKTSAAAGPAAVALEGETGGWETDAHAHPFAGARVSRDGGQPGRGVSAAESPLETPDAVKTGARPRRRRGRAEQAGIRGLRLLRRARAGAGRDRGRRDRHRSAGARPRRARRARSSSAARSSSGRRSSGRRSRRRRLLPRAARADRADRARRLVHDQGPGLPLRRGAHDPGRADQPDRRDDARERPGRGHARSSRRAR